MVGGELRQQAEIAGQLGIDHHAAGQAQRAKDVVQNVHERPLSEYVCGVSVKLSGTAVILANRVFTYIPIIKSAVILHSMASSAFEMRRTRPGITRGYEQ